MQFHKCNARVIAFTDRREGVRIVQFTSYQTAVCRLYYDVESNELFQVDFGRYAKYSPTTTRQVSRFIREYLADEPERAYVLDCFRRMDKNRNCPFQLLLDIVVYKPEDTWDKFGRMY